MANNTLLASDSFASGSLAAGWAAQNGILACKIVGSGASAVAEPNTTNVSAGQIWTGLTWPKDQVSEVTLAPGWTRAAPAPILQLNLRFSSSATNGYAANITGGTGSIGTATLYVITAGAATQLTQTTTLTVVAGDVWSFQCYGPCLALYQNYKIVAFWVDTTYTSGFPGFLLNSSTITNAQVSSWRGYSAVQQDGIWQKQGAANISLVAGDINTGVSFVNSGIDSASQILHEGNAQILSGTVYKMWFGTASGIQYAESTDGLAWSRYGSTVISGFTFPQVIKVGSTYYLYCQSNTVAAGQGNINLYTSTDGINWANQSSTVLTLGGGGAWDHTAIYLFSPVAVIAGTWHALYSGVLVNAFGMGHATSSDGITWTKDAGNPVATSLWASTPYLINGTWYMWAGTVPPGQAATPDPTTGVRVQSTDLITWTNRVQSVQHSQFAEGINGVVGFAYPTAVVNLGNKAYMYFESGPTNTASNTGSSWNLGVASAPSKMSQIILFPEDAVRQVSTDAFTSGAGDLSANWTLPTGGTKLQIIAGPLCEPTAAGSRCQAVYTGASFGNDQYSEATLHTLLAFSNLELMVRASTSALTYYMGVMGGVTGTLANSVSLWKVVAGSFTQIGPSVAATPQVGDVIRCEVVGNVISLYQNGFLIAQAEDVANTITSGNPGLQMLAATAVTNDQVSLWAGGNANVTPHYTGGAMVLSGAEEEEGELQWL